MLSEKLYNYTKSLITYVFKNCIYYDNDYHKIVIVWVFLKKLMKNNPNKKEFVMRLNVFIEELNDF